MTYKHVWSPDYHIKGKDGIIVLFQFCALGGSNESLIPRLKKYIFF